MARRKIGIGRRILRTGGIPGPFQRLEPVTETDTCLRAQRYSAETQAQPSHARGHSQSVIERRDAAVFAQLAHHSARPHPRGRNAICLDVGCSPAGRKPQRIVGSQIAGRLAAAVKLCAVRAKRHGVRRNAERRARRRRSHGPFRLLRSRRWCPVQSARKLLAGPEESRRYRSTAGPAQSCIAAQLPSRYRKRPSSRVANQSTFSRSCRMDQTFSRASAAVTALF